MSGRMWRLSPSDFAFLWEECKRCFYLKSVVGFQRPRTIMPRIFTLIDSQMKACLMRVRTDAVAAGMPSGVIAYSEQWIESRPMKLEGRSSTCYIRGKFDTVVKCDDGTYGVIDFKTSEVKADHVSLYGRQLHAYAYALENPAPRKFGLSPVTRLGLLVFQPEWFANEGGGKGALAGHLTWVEIRRDDPSFLGFLDEVVSVLDQPEPPEATPACPWCDYRAFSRQSGL